MKQDRLPVCPPLSHLEAAGAQGVALLSFENGILCIISKTMCLAPRKHPKNRNDCDSLVPNTDSLCDAEKIFLPLFTSIFPCVKQEGWILVDLSSSFQASCSINLPF